MLQSILLVAKGFILSLVIWLGLSVQPQNPLPGGSAPLLLEPAAVTTVTSTSYVPSPGLRALHVLYLNKHH